jgi:hypothetical protein
MEITLGLLAVFRNEAHIMDEYIKHYINQGVDHFYFINNNSEDEYADILDKYKDIVTLRFEERVKDAEYTGTITTDNIQTKLYEDFLDVIDTDWVLICDFDEFTYARNGYNTIKDFLNERGSEFDQYLVKTKDFNSNGHIEQPDSVIDGFTSRQDQDFLKTLKTKSIIKVDKISRISVHYSILKYGETSNGNLNIKTDIFTGYKIKTIMEKRGIFTKVKELDMINDYVVCNHYMVQSKDWFFNVKARRGIINWPGTNMTVERYQTLYWKYVEQSKRLDDFELSNITKNFKK